MKQEESEIFNHWVARLNNKMRLCELNITCTRTGCNTMMNYGKDKVESYMIVEMFVPDHHAY